MCTVYWLHIEIDNTQEDNAKDLDVVVPMYNLIEYNGNYSKTSGSLWQDWGDEPNSNITDSESFKFKSKLLENTNNAGVLNAKVAVPLKYLSKSRRTLKMSLINFEINLILSWSDRCINSEGKRQETLTITNTKLYIPVASLSTQDNTKLLQQLKSGFKCEINWNK